MRRHMIRHSSRAEKIAAFPRVANGQSLKQENDDERSDERIWMDW
jgi:hypothetical protein